MNFAFWNMHSKAAEWDVPLFLGEFGGPAPTLGIVDYMHLLHKRLNDYLASGAQWNYTPGWTPGALDGWNAEDLSIVNDQGNLRANFKIRPYAQKISGTPTQLIVSIVSNDGKSIELKWYHKSRTGQTELFVPRNDLFGSIPVKIDMEGLGLFCWFDPSQTRLICNSNFDGYKHVRVRHCLMILGLCFLY